MCIPAPPAAIRVAGILAKETAPTTTARTAAATKPLENPLATPFAVVRLPALVATADRTATPRAAPTSWPVMRNPDAIPACCAGIPAIAVTDTETNTMPTPSPKVAKPGHHVGQIARAVRRGGEQPGTRSGDSEANDRDVARGRARQELAGNVRAGRDGQRQWQERDACAECGEPEHGLEEDRRQKHSANQDGADPEHHGCPGNQCPDRPGVRRNERPSHPPLAWLALIAALRGAAESDGLLLQLEEITDGQSLGILTAPVQDLAHLAKATLASQAGDSEAALHHLKQLRIPAITRIAAIDRLDAAVRAGEHAQASAWLDDLASFAGATRWAWALAAVDHGLALLASPDEAPKLFDSALKHHATSSRPYDKARTHLTYGEFLRRAQRRVDARTHLRHALEIFTDLRAEPLVARATQELRASGETARKRDPSTLVMT